MGDMEELEALVFGGGGGGGGVFAAEEEAAVGGGRRVAGAVRAVRAGCAAPLRLFPPLTRVPAAR